ncbi:hypothetical protein GCM10028805_32140 [Spirosoma harenae]
MRKLFILCFFVQIAFTVNAQTAKSKKMAKPFKVAAAVGYASPVERSGNKSLSKAGFVYSIEPQYELIKNLDLGFRIEHAFIQRPEFIDNNYYNQGAAKFMLSGALTANYVLLAANKLRPYLGAGVGLYYVPSSDPVYRIGNTIATYPLPTTTNIGGVGRIGLKFGVGNVELAYNFIGDTSVKNTSTGLTLTGNNSYFSIKAGLTIGGNR